MTAGRPSQRIHPERTLNYCLLKAKLRAIEQMVQSIPKGDQGVADNGRRSL
jgi:hypothetical protein